MNRHQLFLVIATINSLLYALDPKMEEGVSENHPDDKRPVYTNEGIKRIKDNISLLDQNIKDSEKNLENIDRNLSTVNSEIVELRELLTENQELKNRIAEKIVLSKAEVGKNVEAVSKLHKFLNKLDGAKNKQVDVQALKLQQESAMQEIAEREHWNLDASQKLKKFTDMSLDLERGLSQLRTKIPTLEREVILWKKQLGEFQIALETFKKQKNGYLSLLPVDNRTVP